jgi:hypothetical protein
MKNLLISVNFLLIVTLSFSQNIYPSKVVINGDTIIAITTKQLYTLNDTLYHFSNTEKLVNLYKARIDTLSDIILLQNKLISNKDKLIEVSDNKFWECNNALNNCNNNNIKLEKKNKNNLIKLKIFSYLCILEAICLSLIIIR